MRVVLQRVRAASVAVAGETIAAIDAGLLALVGIEAGDDRERARRLAEKTARLRLFPAADRPFERALGDDPARAILVVSQFTLMGDLRRGNRPSWTRAAAPELAAPLVEHYGDMLAATGIRVERGRFGADMAVALVNDGPVTIVLDSADLEGPRR